MRVLLIDSDLDTRYSLSTHLRRYQCVVDETDTGWHAWEMLKCCRYDAAVLELRLRDISGLELLRLMRSLDAAPPTIVGMCDAMPAIQRIAENMGAAGCYVKPLLPEEIFALMMTAVERRGQIGLHDDCAA
ncbi:MAG: response regulator [Armatimonadota bacterium]